MADFLSGFRVSSSGMSAQRTRMNAISSNIANINTVRGADGGPYRRKDVVFEAMPETRNFSEILGVTSPRAEIQRVQVSEIRQDEKAPMLKYEPDHPDANPEGYVAYPNINLMEEMANMLQATRAYEANVSALQSAKDMAMASLEIGR